jgi:hypothetical protein
MMTYPDISKTFHIYTYASDTQIGAVITQNDKPITFYSRTPNSSQKRYTNGCSGKIKRARYYSLLSSKRK